MPERIKVNLPHSLHYRNTTTILLLLYDSAQGNAYSANTMSDWQHKGAFVIQFRPEAEVDSGRFEGRVEHIASSRATHFRSLDEFLAFVAQALKQARADRQDR